MKKLFLMLALLMLISGTSLFSIGLGGAWTFGADNINAGGSGVFLISHDKIPGTMLGVSFRLGNNTSIGISDDWWLYKTHLTGALHLAMGPGFYVTGDFNNNSSTFGFGGRVAIELRAFLMDPFELFLGYYPAVGVGGIGGGQEVTFPVWNVTQFGLGFRFWF